MKYVYKVIGIEDAMNESQCILFEKILNFYGDKGWELIQYSETLFYFKKELLELKLGLGFDNLNPMDKS